MEIWEPIQDLNTGWEEFASTELAGLKDAWREHRERLQGTKALEKFNKEQARQWSIETGIIENLYHIDRGITQMLVEKGLEASYIPHGTTHKSSEEIIRLLRDHQGTLEGLHIFISQQRPLSTSYVKELHQALTRHQKTCDAYDQFGNLQQVALLRGEWKKYPNNPSREDGVAHHYCPPEQVQSEMDRLIELHLSHVEEQVPPEIEAAWLHHRFTQIHPFQDGNGRVARTLASLIFLRDNWFPLTIDRDQRIPYIDALEEADKGDLAPLAELFASNQSTELGKALVLMEEMEKPSIADEVAFIGAYLRQQKGRKTTNTQTVPLIMEVTKSKLEETATLIRNQDAFKDLETTVSAQNQEEYIDKVLHGDNAKVERSAVLNLPLVRLPLTSVQAIGLGNMLRGIVIRVYSTEQQRLRVIYCEAKCVPLMYVGSIFVSVKGKLLTIPFQFGDGEPPEKVLKRYDRWLNEAIIAGLNEWRKQM